MILKHPRQTFFSMTLTTLLSLLQWSNHTKIKGSAFQWVAPSSCLVLSRSISWTSFGESASMEVSRKTVECFGCGKRRVVNELGHHMSLVCFETWIAKAGHPAASISWVYKLSLLHSAWTEVLPGMDVRQTVEKVEISRSQVRNDRRLYRDAEGKSSEWQITCYHQHLGYCNKNNTLSQYDVSASKGVCDQTWWPEFNAQNPPGGRKQLSPDLHMYYDNFIPL